MQFIPTRKGHTLLLDGYTYWQDARSKRTITWYCSKRNQRDQKCLAFIKTDHNYSLLLSASTIHNHEKSKYAFAKEQIMVNYKNMVMSKSDPNYHHYD